MDRPPARLLLNAAIVGLVAGTLTLNGVAVLYLANGAEPARESRDAQLRTLRLLVECRTAPTQRTPPEEHPPATDCYLRQQAAAAAAAACGAAHPGDVPATLRCVEAIAP